MITVSFILIYFIVWTVFYIYLKQIYQTKSAEWISRIVALTHAFIICRFIELDMFIIGPWLFDALGSKNTISQNAVLHISCAYFIFDTIWCLYYSRKDILMLAHHTISLMGMIASLYMQRSAAEVLLTTWGAELTNPYLQVRWYLRENGLSKSMFSFLNDLLFTLSFFVIRICIGAVLTYKTYMSKEINSLIKLGGCSFFIVNMLWMIQIAKFAKRKFFGKLSLD